MKLAGYIAALAIFAYGASLYQPILELTERRGFDAPIYWQAGRGNVENAYTGDKESLGWTYSDRVLPVFALWAKLPYPRALLLLHLANCAGLAAIAFALAAGLARWPHLATIAILLLGNKASDILCGANIEPALAGLALTPAGALAAAAVKPHYVLAVVLHAVAIGQRRRFWRAAGCSTDGSGITGPGAPAAGPVFPYLPKGPR